MQCALRRNELRPTERLAASPHQLAIASRAQQAARLIKETMDKKYNGSWGVIIGEGFGFEVPPFFCFRLPHSRCINPGCDCIHPASGTRQILSRGESGRSLEGALSAYLGAGMRGPPRKQAESLTVSQGRGA